MTEHLTNWGISAFSTDEELFIQGDSPTAGTVFEQIIGKWGGGKTYPTVVTKDGRHFRLGRAHKTQTIAKIALRIINLPQLNPDHIDHPIWKSYDRGWIDLDGITVQVCYHIAPAEPDVGIMREYLDEVCLFDKNGTFSKFLHDRMDNLKLEESVHEQLLSV